MLRFYIFPSSRIASRPHSVSVLARSPPITFSTGQLAKRTSETKKKQCPPTAHIKTTQKEEDKITVALSRQAFGSRARKLIVRIFIFSSFGVGVEKHFRSIFPSYPPCSPTLKDSSQGSVNTQQGREGTHHSRPLSPSGVGNRKRMENELFGFSKIPRNLRRRTCFFPSSYTEGFTDGFSEMVRLDIVSFLDFRSCYI